MRFVRKAQRILVGRRSVSWPGTVPRQISVLAIWKAFSPDPLWPTLHGGVAIIVLDEFHHLFDVDRAKVMTKASQWLRG